MSARAVSAVMIFLLVKETRPEQVIELHQARARHGINLKTLGTDIKSLGKIRSHIPFRGTRLQDR